MTLLKKFVIIRTFSAGVHCGILEKFAGMCVRLSDARRVWSWGGANTLSEISLRGCADTSNISEPVDCIVLTEVIEVILCTPEAIANLRTNQWN